VCPVRAALVQESEPAQAIEALEELKSISPLPEPPSATPTHEEWLHSVRHLVDSVHMAKSQLAQERNLVAAAVESQLQLLRALACRTAELKRALCVVRAGLSLLACLDSELEDLVGAEPCSHSSPSPFPHSFRSFSGG
jgi:hypothetical protein